MTQVTFSECGPDRADRADIVVGIPPVGRGHVLSHSVEQADLGLRLYFPDRQAVIIHSDHDLASEARDSFWTTKTRTPRLLLLPDRGVTGKGTLLRALFRKTLELKARACIILDGNSKGVSPKWIRNLGEPLFNGFGFVAPLYTAHRFSSPLTDHVIYPLTRALYGRRVRQPMGGSFGISGDLAGIYAEHPFWDDNVANAGIYVWMTTLAICHNVRICQSVLGRPEPGGRNGPLEESPETFRQASGTLFSMMPHLSPFWKKVRWSRPTAVFGLCPGEPELRQPMEPVRTEREGAMETDLDPYRGLWEEVLGPESLSGLDDVLAKLPSRLEFPPELWARILFDYAVAHRTRGGASEEVLLSSLIPLYLLRRGAFLRQCRGVPASHAEEYVERECVAFEEAKAYLTERWRE